MSPRVTAAGLALLATMTSATHITISSRCQGEGTASCTDCRLSTTKSIAPNGTLKDGPCFEAHTSGFDDSAKFACVANDQLCLGVKWDCTKSSGRADVVVCGKCFPLEAETSVMTTCSLGSTHAKRIYFSKSGDCNGGDTTVTADVTVTDVTDRCKYLAKPGQLFKATTAPTRAKPTPSPPSAAWCATGLWGVRSGAPRARAWP